MKFVSGGLFSEPSINAFDHQQGISPGIVVGRLQFDQHLDWATSLNHLKAKHV
jgi:hypothetical protein